MSKEIRVIRKAECKIANWSSGTTTELYLYPPDTSYQQRNFSWRLSVATVNEEQSNFTRLPGVWRTLMLLEGDIVLEHHQHHNMSLQPFDQDSFDGGWQTKCFGKATDFNLMTCGEYRGALAAVAINSQESFEVNRCVTDGPGRVEAYVIYVWRGQVTVMAGGATCDLGERDVCCLTQTAINQPLSIVLHNDGKEQADCVITTIYVEPSKSLEPGVQ